MLFLSHNSSRRALFSMPWRVDEVYNEKYSLVFGPQSQGPTFCGRNYLLACRLQSSVSFSGRDHACVAPRPLGTITIDPLDMMVIIARQDVHPQMWLRSPVISIKRPQRPSDVIHKKLYLMGSYNCVISHSLYIG